MQLVSTTTHGERLVIRLTIMPPSVATGWLDQTDSIDRMQRETTLRKARVAGAQAALGCPGRWSVGGRPLSGAGEASVVQGALGSGRRKRLVGRFAPARCGRRNRLEEGQRAVVSRGSRLACGWRRDWAAAAH